jgi:hypothetical protein
MIKSIKNHCHWLFGKLNIFGNTTRSIKREAQEASLTKESAAILDFHIVNAAGGGTPKLSKQKQAVKTQAPTQFGAVFAVPTENSYSLQCNGLRTRSVPGNLLCRGVIC